VVLVCQGGTRARMARELLAGSGRNLTVLEGGTDAWIKEGARLSATPSHAGPSSGRCV
jgi:rhodanese-related sulfurtransferase